MTNAEEGRSSFEGTSDDAHHTDATEQAERRVVPGKGGVAGPTSFMINHAFNGSLVHIEAGAAVHLAEAGEVQT